MPQHRGSVREPLTCLHVDYDAIWLVFAVARELRTQRPCFPGMTPTPDRDERRWNMWYHGRNAREVNGRYQHLSHQPHGCQKAKNAMTDVVAKQLVAASQLLVQEVRFWSHGATVSVSVERWNYIAWGVQRDGTRLYTLEVSIAHIGYRV